MHEFHRHRVIKIDSLNDKLLVGMPTCISLALFPFTFSLLGDMSDYSSSEFSLTVLSSCQRVMQGLCG